MAHWIQPPDEYFYPYCSDCGAECLSYRDYDSLSPHLGIPNSLAIPGVAF